MGGANIGLYDALPRSLRQLPASCVGDDLNVHVVNYMGSLQAILGFRLHYVSRDVHL